MSAVSVAQVSEPLSPRSRNRAAECQEGAGANTSNMTRALTDGTGQSDQERHVSDG
jgi:hypothetical protein